MSGGGPVAVAFPDGRRHFQHGPIDLIIEAFGDGDEVEQAYRQAWSVFEGVLAELVDELDLLRAAVTAHAPTPRGAVARRMMAAVRPHAAVFITPMAAVAGAVSDAVLEAMARGRRLRRAYVNNGGDIALFLAPGEAFRAAMVFNLDVPGVDGIATITAGSAVRGLATSGWRGRSFSLGIADSATVLARTAAAADAAATLLANAVTIDHPSIIRVPASDLAADSDLGERPVTVAVGELDARSVTRALDNGAGLGRRLLADGLIEGAVITLQGEARVIGSDAGALPMPAQARGGPTSDQGDAA